MNKRIIFYLFSAIFILCLSSNPQEKSREASIKRVLDQIIMTNKQMWEICAMELELGKKRSAFTTRDVVAYLDSQNNIVSDIRLKYKSQIKQILNAMDVMGDRTVFYFTKFPVRIFKYNDGYCILITLAIDTIYNTIRTTSNSRFAETLRACVIPKIGYFSEEFESEEIRYFGFIITYGSRNFLEESGYPNLRAELGCIIINKIDCQKFTDGEITENELLANSNKYLSDRDMLLGFKKVDIKID